MAIDLDLSNVKRIDFPRIAAATNRELRLATFDEERARCGNHVILTDALLSSRSMGTMILEILDYEEKQARGVNVDSWRLLVLTDEWGHVPQPGELVTREVFNGYRDKLGRKLTARGAQSALQAGRRDEFYTYRRYTVDERGCITCGYTDAVTFLNDFGVTYHTGGRIALCSRPELSNGPCRAPDGSQKHVHYWRFMEIPPECYEQLPLRTNTEDAPRAKRGRPAKNADNSVEATE
jgi:hypothetical protein